VKVLVTGAAGQLGRALAGSCPAGVEVVTRDRSGLDLTDASAVHHCLETVRPRAVINAAAYTAVDRAESEPEAAHAANADAPGYLAAACVRTGARLIHLSTDFVFDGKRGSPYAPDAATAPLGVYGATKAEGERRIAATDGLAFRIVRTAWVHGPAGHNFVLRMLELFRTRPELRVVCDQVGTPTSVLTLAPLLWWLAGDDGPSGIVHFTDAGVASWYDFAVAIHEEGVARGLAPADVGIIPVATAQYPTPARRPPYSVLDKSATWARYPGTPLHWRVALRKVFDRIKA
jgi:dTDP-4-dehydrorhamnose reductase